MEMALPKARVKTDDYYSGHIDVRYKRAYKSEMQGTITTYDCFLCGERIGHIEHASNRSYDRKPYQAYALQVERYYKSPEKYWLSDEQRAYNVGYFDTLFEAKKALFPKAKEYLADVKTRESQRKTPVAFLPDQDTQFYPTPPALAGELMRGVDFRLVSSILEPSAGRGDLIECVLTRMKKGRERYCRDADEDIVDCIEIDENLRSLLTGKGFRVVHDDFLDYVTKKVYSLIIMNPPFSEGDEHLLKALEMVSNGGQVACILNADTIRNPFTNRRKALVARLKKLGASIRFVKGAFKKAARKSDVEVALINVKVPFSYSDTFIWDDLQRARTETLEAQGLQELAPANQVERLILEYTLLCESGIKLMKLYNGVVPRIQRSKPDGSKFNYPLISIKVCDHERDMCGAEDVNAFLRKARYRYWSELFDLPELRDKMTSDMRDKYQRTIEDMANYEFSMFNIQTVIDRIKSQIVTGVEDAIIKCFDKLSGQHAYHETLENENIHYYNGWKTNKAHYVNMKCIIPTWGCFATEYKYNGRGGYSDVQTHIAPNGCFDVLTDLEKALNYLDKDETTSIDLLSVLVAAKNANRNRNIECKYFTVTFFKKGTCHIKFRDQKIVDRLNIFVGRQRAWLPPSYGSVRYEDMDEESRRVVDEFQGSEKYAEVFARRNDYIIETGSIPLLMS